MRGRASRAGRAGVAALVLCGVVASAGLAASTDFTERNSSPEVLSADPNAITALDFDDDRDQDLAVANGGADNVTILRSSGLGNFIEHDTSPETVGGGPLGIVSGDVDGDEDPDLVTANFGSNSVTVLLNDGAGDFSEPVTSPESAGSRPRSVAHADLDADGDSDLAVANENSDDVTILLNVGSGDFVERISSPETAGDGPRSIAAADLDGDGDQDLATANLGSDDMTLLRNSGHGNFAEPVTSPAPSGDGPTSVVAADLDRDGDPELATAAFNSSDVTILRNDGGFNFVERASSPHSTGLSPNSLTSADFDLDRDQDLATANFNSSDVTILRNSGLGNFAEPTTSPEAADGPVAIVAVDLDRDGDDDLAVANQSSPSLTILMND